MAYIPGDTLTETVPVADSTSTPVTGLTFTTLVTANPDGDEFALSYTEVGTGTYRFVAHTSAGDPLGNWFALVQASDADSQLFSLSWTLQDVDRPNPYYVGQELVETFALVDASNDPITGATFTVLEERNPQGVALNETVEELGNGVYRFTIPDTDVTIEGSYFLLVQADDTLSQVVELEWQVSPTTVVTYATPTGSLTRKDLRRAILGLLGDLTITTATATSGSAQWTDLDTLAFGDSGRFAGRHLYVTSGTTNNVGQLRAISGSNGQGTIELTRVLPSAVAIGDEAEIVNTRGTGFTVNDVHRAIDTAIMKAGAEVRITATIEDAFDNTSRWVELPGEFTAVDGVSFNYDTDDDTYSVREVPHARALHGEGWSVDRANRRLYIGGNVGLGMDGVTVSIRGWGLPPALTADDDLCVVNSEWVIYDAASSLLLRAIGSGRVSQVEWERKGFNWQQVAANARDLTRPRRSVNYTRLI